MLVGQRLHRVFVPLPTPHQHRKRQMAQRDSLHARVLVISTFHSWIEIVWRKLELINHFLVVRKRDLHPSLTIGFRITNYRINFLGWQSNSSRRSLQSAIWLSKIFNRFIWPIWIGSLASTYSDVQWKKSILLKKSMVLWSIYNLLRPTGITHSSKQ